MSRIQLHLSAAPLVVVQVPTRVTIDAARALSRDIATLHARREPFATVVDLSGVDSAPHFALRRELCDWLYSARGDIAAHNVFTAIAVDQPIARGAVRAMQWMTDSAVRQVIVPTFREALVLAVDHLRAIDARVPTSLDAAVRDPKVTTTRRFLSAIARESMRSVA